jgi:Sfi1 spindle body protein
MSVNTTQSTSESWNQDENVDMSIVYQMAHVADKLLQDTSTSTAPAAGQADPHKAANMHAILQAYTHVLTQHGIDPTSDTRYYQFLVKCGRHVTLDSWQARVKAQERQQQLAWSAPDPRQTLPIPEQPQDRLNAYDDTAASVQYSTVPSDVSAISDMNLPIMRWLRNHGSASASATFVSDTDTTANGVAAMNATAPSRIMQQQLNPATTSATTVAPLQQRQQHPKTSFSLSFHVDNDTNGTSDGTYAVSGRIKPPQGFLKHAIPLLIPPSIQHEPENRPTSHDTANVTITAASDSSSSLISPVSQQQQQQQQQQQHTRSSTRQLIPTSFEYEDDLATQQQLLSRSLMPARLRDSPFGARLLLSEYLRIWRVRTNQKICDRRNEERSRLDNMRADYFRRQHVLSACLYHWNIAAYNHNIRIASIVQRYRALRDPRRYFIRRWRRRVREAHSAEHKLDRALTHWSVRLETGVFAKWFGWAHSRHVLRSLGRQIVFRKFFIFWKNRWGHLRDSEMRIAQNQQIKKQQRLVGILQEWKANAFRQRSLRNKSQHLHAQLQHRRTALIFHSWRLRTLCEPMRRHTLTKYYTRPALSNWLYATLRSLRAKRVGHLHAQRIRVDGFLRWRQALRQRMLFRRAERHASVLFQRRLVRHWARVATASKTQDAMHRMADHHHTQLLAKTMIGRWRQSVAENASFNQQLRQADVLKRNLLLHRVVQQWHNVAVEHTDARQLLVQANEHYRLRISRARALARWHASARTTLRLRTTSQSVRQLVVHKHLKRTFFQQWTAAVDDLSQRETQIRHHRNIILGRSALAGWRRLLLSRQAAQLVSNVVDCRAALAVFEHLKQNVTESLNDERRAIAFSRTHSGRTMLQSTWHQWRSTLATRLRIIRQENRTTQLRKVAAFRAWRFAIHRVAAARHISALRDALLCRQAWKLWQSTVAVDVQKQSVAQKHLVHRSLRTWLANASSRRARRQLDEKAAHFCRTSGVSGALQQWKVSGLKHSKAAQDVAAQNQAAEGLTLSLYVRRWHRRAQSNRRRRAVELAGDIVIAEHHLSKSLLKWKTVSDQAKSRRALDKLATRKYAHHSLSVWHRTAYHRRRLRIADIKACVSYRKRAVSASISKLRMAVLTSKSMLRLDTIGASHSISQPLRRAVQIWRSRAHEYQRSRTQCATATQHFLAQQLKHHIRIWHTGIVQRRNRARHTLTASQHSNNRILGKAWLLWRRQAHISHGFQKAIRAVLHTKERHALNSWLAFHVVSRKHRTLRQKVSEFRQMQQRSRIVTALSTWRSRTSRSIVIAGFQQETMARRLRAAMSRWQMRAYWRRLNQKADSFAERRQVLQKYQLEKVATSALRGWQRATHVQRFANTRRLSRFVTAWRLTVLARKQRQYQLEALRRIPDRSITVSESPQSSLPTPIGPQEAATWSVQPSSSHISLAGSQVSLEATDENLSEPSMTPTLEPRSLSRHGVVHQAPGLHNTPTSPFAPYQRQQSRNVEATRYEMDRGNAALSSAAAPPTTVNTGSDDDDPIGLSLSTVARRRPPNLRSESFHSALSVSSHGDGDMRTVTKKPVARRASSLDPTLLSITVVGPQESQSVIASAEPALADGLSPTPQSSPTIESDAVVLSPRQSIDSSPSPPAHEHPGLPPPYQSSSQYQEQYSQVGSLSDRTGISVSRHDAYQTRTAAAAAAAAAAARRATVHFVPPLELHSHVDSSDRRATTFAPGYSPPNRCVRSPDTLSNASSLSDLYSPGIASPRPLYSPTSDGHTDHSARLFGTIPLETSPRSPPDHNDFRSGPRSPPAAAAASHRRRISSHSIGMIRNIDTNSSEPTASDAPQSPNSANSYHAGSAQAAPLRLSSPASSPTETGTPPANLHSQHLRARRGSASAPTSPMFDPNRHAMSAVPENAEVHADGGNGDGGNGVADGTPADLGSSAVLEQHPLHAASSRTASQIAAARANRFSRVESMPIGQSSIQNVSRQQSDPVASLTQTTDSSRLDVRRVMHRRAQSVLTPRAMLRPAQLTSVEILPSPRVHITHSRNPSHMSQFSTSSPVIQPVSPPSVPIIPEVLTSSVNSKISSPSSVAAAVPGTVDSKPQSSPEGSDSGAQLASSPHLAVTTNPTSPVNGARWAQRRPSAPPRIQSVRTISHSSVSVMPGLTRSATTSATHALPLPISAMMVPQIVEYSTSGDESAYTDSSRPSTPASRNGDDSDVDEQHSEAGLSVSALSTSLTGRSDPNLSVIEVAHTELPPDRTSDEDDNADAEDDESDEGGDEEEQPDNITTHNATAQSGNASDASSLQYEVDDAVAIIDKQPEPTGHADEAKAEPQPEMPQPETPQPETPQHHHRMGSLDDDYDDEDGIYFIAGEHPHNDSSLSLWSLYNMANEARLARKGDVMPRLEDVPEDAPNEARDAVILLRHFVSWKRVVRLLRQTKAMFKMSMTAYRMQRLSVGVEHWKALVQHRRASKAAKNFRRNALLARGFETWWLRLNDCQLEHIRATQAMEHWGIRHMKRHLLAWQTYTTTDSLRSSNEQSSCDNSGNEIVNEDDQVIELDLTASSCLSDSSSSVSSAVNSDGIFSQHNPSTFISAAADDDVIEPLIGRLEQIVINGTLRPAFKLWFDYAQGCKQINAMSACVDRVAMHRALRAWCDVAQSERLNKVAAIAYREMTMKRVLLRFKSHIRDSQALRKRQGIQHNAATQILSIAVRISQRHQLRNAFCGWYDQRLVTQPVRVFLQRRWTHKQRTMFQEWAKLAPLHAAARTFRLRSVFLQSLRYWRLRAVRRTEVRDATADALVALSGSQIKRILAAWKARAMQRVRLRHSAHVWINHRFGLPLVGRFACVVFVAPDARPCFDRHTAQCAIRLSSVWHSQATAFSDMLPQHQHSQYQSHDTPSSAQLAQFVTPAAADVYYQSGNKIVYALSVRQQVAFWLPVGGVSGASAAAGMRRNRYIEAEAHTIDVIVPFSASNDPDTEEQDIIVVAPQLAMRSCWMWWKRAFANRRAVSDKVATLQIRWSLRRWKQRTSSIGVRLDKHAMNEAAHDAYRLRKLQPLLKRWRQNAMARAKHRKLQLTYADIIRWRLLAKPLAQWMQRVDMTPTQHRKLRYFSLHRTAQTKQRIWNAWRQATRTRTRAIQLDQILHRVARHTQLRTATTTWMARVLELNRDDKLNTKATKFRLLSQLERAIRHWHRNSQAHRSLRRLTVDAEHFRSTVSLQRALHIWHRASQVRRLASEHVRIVKRNRHLRSAVACMRMWRMATLQSKANQFSAMRVVSSKKAIFKMWRVAYRSRIIQRNRERRLQTAALRTLCEYTQECHRQRHVIAIIRQHYAESSMRRVVARWRLYVSRCQHLDAAKVQASLLHRRRIASTVFNTWRRQLQLRMSARHARQLSSRCAKRMAFLTWSRKCTLVHRMKCTAIEFANATQKQHLSAIVRSWSRNAMAIRFARHAAKQRLMNAWQQATQQQMLDRQADALAARFAIRRLQACVVKWHDRTDQSLRIHEAAQAFTVTQVHRSAAHALHHWRLCTANHKYAHALLEHGLTQRAMQLARFALIRWRSHYWSRIRKYEHMNRQAVRSDYSRCARRALDVWQSALHVLEAKRHQMLMQADLHHAVSLKRRALVRMRHIVHIERLASTYTVRRLQHIVYAMFHDWRKATHVSRRLGARSNVASQFYGLKLLCSTFVGWKAYARARKHSRRLQRDSARADDTRMLSVQADGTVANAADSMDPDDSQIGLSIARLSNMYISHRS